MKKIEAIVAIAFCIAGLWYLDNSSMEQCLQLGNSFSDCEELRR